MAKYAKPLKKAGNFYVRTKINSYKHGGREAYDWNERHDVIGITPDHWVSPVDFTPVGWVNKVGKGYRAAKTAKKLKKAKLTNYGRKAKKSSKRSYKKARHAIYKKGITRYVKRKSRSGSNPSSSPGRNASGHYYWKRKRSYRK